MFSDDDIESFIRSVVSTKDGKDFITYIFQTANLDDYSISCDIQKDYYFLGRQSLANDIRNLVKQYNFDEYLNIEKEIHKKQ